MITSGSNALLVACDSTKENSSSESPSSAFYARNSVC